MTGPDFNTDANLHADTVAERYDSRREGIITSHNFGWMAHRKDYCGCGTCKSLLGIGMTEQAAIDDLLEQEENAAS